MFKDFFTYKMTKDAALMYRNFDDKETLNTMLMPLRKVTLIYESDCLEQIIEERHAPESKDCMTYIIKRDGGLICGNVDDEET